MNDARWPDAMAVDSLGGTGASPARAVKFKIRWLHVLTVLKNYESGYIPGLGRGHTFEPLGHFFSNLRV